MLPLSPAESWLLVVGIALVLMGAGALLWTVDGVARALAEQVEPAAWIDEATGYTENREEGGTWEPK